MLKKIISITLATVLVFTISFFNNSSVLASPLDIFLNSSTFAILGLEGKPPKNLGIKEGILSPCPATPNCVVSQNGDTTHSIDPIPYHADRNTAKQVLLQVLTVVPKTKIIEEKDDYIRTEFASSLLGFVDDGEFYFPEDEQVIQIRSASRLGESDLGVNRRRLEQIRLALQDLGI